MPSYGPRNRSSFRGGRPAINSYASLLASLGKGLVIYLAEDHNQEMLPVLVDGLRHYAPWALFPFTAAIGAVGYGLESAVSDRHTPASKAVKDRREERHLVDYRIDDDFRVPKTIFDRI